MANQRILLATTPVSWGVHDGASRALGADPVEWRQPSGLMLTDGGWAAYGSGGSGDGLDALRSEVDALVRLYFVADGQTRSRLSEEYSGVGVGNAAEVSDLYGSTVYTVAYIAQAAGAPAASFAVDRKFSTGDGLFTSVFLSHGGEVGWASFWPDDAVGLMDEELLGAIAQALMGLARNLVGVTDGAFAGHSLDWDVLMAGGGYPNVAALL